MGRTGDQAPEIPGFQPLHIRGAGRLGIWIEARQVRLDRRVLLKVLPAAENDLQQEFVREVQALVQLDGGGALRVIDEGTVGRARYVALDEGDAVPMTDFPQDLEQKLELGRCLIDLYQRLHRLGIVAGPVPVNAVRKLPSGGFVVSELGAVATDGGEREIRHRAAQTLEQLGSSFEMGAPWTEAARLLRADADGFRRARQVIDRHVAVADRLRSRIKLLIGVIVIVSAGILGPRWWHEADQDPVGGDSEAVVVSSSQENGGEQGTEESVDSGTAQEVPRDQDEIDREIAGQVDEMASIRFEQQEQLQQDRSIWGTWRPLRDRILAFLEAGDLAVARQHIADLPIEIEGAGGYGSSTDEREALFLAWSWIEQRKIAQVRVRMKSAIAVDNYSAAAALLNELSQQLGLQQRFSAELKRLERRELLFAQSLQTMEQRMEQTLLALPGFLQTELAEPDGLESFPRLQTRWSSFNSSCQLVQRDARSLISAVEGRIGVDEAQLWCLREGEPFDARATAVDEATISLRKVGRRNAELHPWSRISSETLLQLARESRKEIPDEDQLLAGLRIIWGGSESILDIARDRSANEEIFLTAGRLRRQQIESWFADGVLAEQQGDAERQRVRSIEIARWVDDLQRPQIEEQLLKWWGAVADRDGPSSLGLFPQTKVSDWDQETGALQIHWQANENGLSGWKSSPGSTISVRGELTWIQGRVHLDSPVRFADSLEVRITGLVTREDAPNLNVVLWDGTPWALLFGVGVRPPDISSIRVGDEDVLLPAHMIIEEKMLAEGGGDIPMPAPRPRVVPGKPARMLVREDGVGSYLEVDGETVLEAIARPVALVGGVAIETFGVPVVIREVIVKGRIDNEDWFVLLHQRARSALWRQR